MIDYNRNHLSNETGNKREEEGVYLMGVEIK